MTDLKTRKSVRSVPYHIQRITRTTSPQQIQTGTHISRLYPELLALIFEKLSVGDRGRAAQVCRTWREAADQRSVWKNVEATLHLGRQQSPLLLSSLARRGIRRLKILSLHRGLKVDVAGISGLESLSLSGCDNITDLTSVLATELPSLKRLDLSFCTLLTVSSLDKIIPFLENLEELRLDHCYALTHKGLLVIARGLQKLRTLHLSFCSWVNDAAIAHLCGDGKAQRGTILLEVLDLQECPRLTDNSLLYISRGLPKLQSINLSYLSVTDNGLRYLAKLPELAEVILHSCQGVSDAGVVALAEGGHLKILDVSYCEGIGDEAIVAGLFGLKSLNLCECPKVTDEGLQKIALMSDLEILDIRHCDLITDHGLKVLANGLRKLKEIYLYGCTEITEEGLDTISLLPNLEVITLKVIEI